MNTNANSSKSFLHESQNTLLLTVIMAVLNHVPKYLIHLIFFTNLVIIEAMHMSMLLYMLQVNVTLQYGK